MSFKVQTREVNAAGTRLGPWRDLRSFGYQPSMTLEQAEAKARSLDRDGLPDPKFIRIVEDTPRV